MATKKAAASAATKKAEQAATPAANSEVMYQCTVLAQEDKKPIKIGCVICGAGAKAVLPKAQAEAARDLGHVRIDGIAK